MTWNVEYTDEFAPIAAISRGHATVTFANYACSMEVAPTGCFMPLTHAAAPCC